MNKIITAGIKYGSLQNMNRRLSSGRRQMGRGGRLPVERGSTGDPVIARVNLGRWIGDCQCGGAELVDQDDPRFYCHTCDNLGNDGNYRPVVFPRNYKAIEVELLKRRGRTSGDFVLPDNDLPREWVPTETVEDLKKQRIGGLK